MKLFGIAKIPPTPLVHYFAFNAGKMLEMQAGMFLFLQWYCYNIVPGEDMY